jgi:hypothetical protein
MCAEPLDSATRTRLESFQRYTAAHPRLVAAKDALLSAIQFGEPNSIVMVFGPTGVGKTTLLRRVENLLIDKAATDANALPGRLPVVTVEAVAPDSGNFGWRDYFIRLLDNMEDPSTRYNCLPVNPPTFVKTGRRTESTARYRYAVEQALRHRRPGAVIIDEAQHFTRLSSGRRLLDQLDVIKSMANQTQTVHVLAGTYELLALRDLNGQLSRRTTHVHIARYRADDVEDRKAFIQTVYSLQQVLPFRELPDLVREWRFLYDCSSGCVGILKQLLARTLADALSRNAATFSRADLERHALPSAQRERILAETMDGESRFDRGYVPGVILPGPKSQTSTAAKKPRKSSRVPGSRRPQRDIVNP